MLWIYYFYSIFEIQGIYQQRSGMYTTVSSSKLQDFSKGVEKRSFWATFQFDF